MKKLYEAIEKQINKNRLWRWLYPAHCALCDTVLGRKEEGLCTACRKKVRISRYGFPGGTAPFPYLGVYRDAVRRFKYSGRAEYAAFFAEAILAACTSGSDSVFTPADCSVYDRQDNRPCGMWRPDALVPVPIHRERFRERGYNQAEELARELSRRMHVPCIPDLAVRKRNTLPQNGLDVPGRKKNIRGAFAVKKGRAVPKKVLLVDDIRTTGSTLGELGSVLSAHGAEEICAVCVCMAGDPFSFA